MTKLKLRLLSAFVIGFVVGIIGSRVLEPTARISDTVRTEVTSFESAAAIPSLAESESPIRINRDDEQVEAAESFSPNSTSLPNLYQEMIGPTYRYGPSLAESHVTFGNETRDESWAAAMEAGIVAYFSRVGPERGIVLEYAECRSEHCEVAGLITDGYPERDYITIVELRNEPWWNGGKQGGGTSRRFNGQLYFVYVLIRYDME